jgi:hypothetical protein
MEALERDVARPIPVVLFPLADMRDALCNVANDGWLNFDGLSCRLVSVSAYVRGERQIPFRRHQVQRPSVPSVFGQELDWRVHGGVSPETWELLQSITLPPLQADRASTHRAQRCRSECLVPERWDADEAKGLNPRPQEGVIHAVLIIHDTCIDAG